MTKDRRCHYVQPRRDWAHSHACNNIQTGLSRGSIYTPPVTFQHISCGTWEHDEALDEFSREVKSFPESLDNPGKMTHTEGRVEQANVSEDEKGEPRGWERVVC